MNYRRGDLLAELDRLADLDLDEPDVETRLEKKHLAKLLIHLDSERYMG